MDELELICFKMISNLGGARSMYMESIEASRKGDFQKAQDLIKEGEALRQLGHDVHFDLLTKESSGDKTAINLLLVHAEDQLMSAEIIQLVAEESLLTHQRIYQLEQQLAN